MKLLILLFSSLFFLSGCGSSGYAITYNTSPEGVLVVCNGQHKGYSPVTLYYDFDKGKNYAKSELCYAQWSQTGYKKFSNSWNLNKYPNGVMQTLDVSTMVNASSPNSKYKSNLNTQKNTKSKDRCKFNYYKVGNSCYKLPTDAVAYNIADGFYCVNGKYKSGNICVSNESSNSLNNSNASSGYKSSFGNTYAYDLSNPSDQLKYKTDPAAQLRDRTSNQYIKELESILGESGGGVFQKNNSPSWNNNMWNNNSWNNNSWNNNSPTWDWVN
jgi:hypothetical protein